MTKLIIVYWRDIPAQLMIGKGRQAKKYKLPEKYEKAIDLCAMKVGAKDSEAYLKYWRKEIISFNDNRANNLEHEAKKIEIEYSEEKLKKLIRNGGWEKPSEEIQRKDS